VVSDRVGTARPPVLFLLALTVFALVASVALPAADGAARRRLGVVAATATAGASAVLLAVVLAGVELPVLGFATTPRPRLDVRVPGNADLFVGLGFYRYAGLGSLVWLAMPVLVGWLLVGIATVWTRPGRALAAGVLGLPLVATDLRAASSLPLPGSLQGDGVLLVVALGLLAVTLSLLVLAVRTVRAGSGMTGATV
jgi:hypothetical protein